MLARSPGWTITGIAAKLDEDREWLTGKTILTRFICPNANSETLAGQVFSFQYPHEDRCLFES